MRLCFVLFALVLLAGACSEYTVRPNVFEDHYVQEGRNVVDVLVMVDNSCSMAEEQGKLGANFETFIEAFVESDVDYQVANITSDMMDPGYQGKLHQGSRWECEDPALPETCHLLLDEQGQPIPTGTAIIDRDTEDAAAVFLGNTKLGTSGSGFEMGLEAARWALCRARDPRLPVDADIIQAHCPELWDEYQGGASLAEVFTNRGFLRDEATLSIIFVSDEDDFSHDPVATYLTAYVGAKGDAENPDRGYRDHDLLNASAVVGDAPAGCPPGDNPIAVPGFRYLDVAQRTGGVQDSICNEDFTPIVRDLGLVISGLRRRFPLTRLPAVESLDVQVIERDSGAEVDPAQFRWVYDDTENSVVFDLETLPQPGTEVVLRYRGAGTIEASR